MFSIFRALKAITGQDFGQSKETTTTIHKQFIRSTAEYYSISWTLNQSDTHYNTLQIQQNNALRTATGCTKTIPIDHLHRETKTIKFRDHIPTAPSGTSNSTQIHNTLATRYINELGPNSVSGRIPPKVNDSEAELSSEDKVHRGGDRVPTKKPL